MQSSRNPVKVEETPAPGAYQTMKEFGSELQKITIGKRRYESPQEKVPPVGAYEVTDSFLNVNSASNFGLQSGRKERKSVDQLCPCTYTPHKSFGDDLNQSTIGQRRPETVNESPSVGQYRVQDKLTKPRSPCVDFGSASARKSERQERVPGPGDYNPGREFGKEAGLMTIG
jgi:hypothetical protein